jgi:hypothetical protein
MRSLLPGGKSPLGVDATLSAAVLLKGHLESLKGKTSYRKGACAWGDL